MAAVGEYKDLPGGISYHLLFTSGENPTL
jgi:hypothetical protein